MIPRTRSVRNLATIALACALGSFVPVASAPDAPRLFGLLAAAFTAAAIVLGFLWSATRGTRAATAYLFGFLALAGTLALPDSALRPAALVLLAVAATLVVRESGLAIAIDEGSLSSVRTFPIASRSTIRWSEVEWVTIDAVVILVQGSGPDRVEREARLIVRGGGQQIACNTARYAMGLDLIRDILDRCRPSALRWTQEQRERHGRVRLGSLELRREGIAWSRVRARRKRQPTSAALQFAACALFPYLWIPYLAARAMIRHAKGWEECGYGNAEIGIDVEANAVWIRAGSEERWLPLHRVPNAFLLPELLAAMAPGTGQKT